MRVNVPQTALKTLNSTSSWKPIDRIAPIEMYSIVRTRNQIKFPPFAAIWPDTEACQIKSNVNCIHTEMRTHSHVIVAYKGPQQRENSECISLIVLYNACFHPFTTRLKFHVYECNCHLHVDDIIGIGMGYSLLQAYESAFTRKLLAWQTIYRSSVKFIRTIHMLNSFNSVLKSMPHKNASDYEYRGLHKWHNNGRDKSTYVDGSRHRCSFQQVRPTPLLLITQYIRSEIGALEDFPRYLLNDDLIFNA